ncbi:MAG: hypothetical protein ABH826_04865 [Patescibacteria group bacterium]
MKIKKLPSWILSGLAIFPVLIVLGIVLFALTVGKFSILFWLIIPSIIFEELFETCCYVFSDSQVVNLFFALLFWFIIGAAVGWVSEKLQNPSRNRF